MDYLQNKFDIIVVGAGHAGCETAIASAKLGCKVLLCTLNIDNIALMPCNPAIGGPAKSTLVREIDAHRIVEVCHNLKWRDSCQTCCH